MIKIYFKEEQKYRQAWLWLIIVPLVAGSFLYFLNGFNIQLIQGDTFGNKPMSDAGLLVAGIFTMGIMIGVAGLFYYTRMILTIATDGIHLRYPPLISKERIFRKEEIARYEVRRYKPIIEFGGWGVKQGNKKNGTAYNVRGNIGLQIVMTDGRKIMFGTQRKEAIAMAMKKMTGSGNEIKMN